MDSVAYTGVSGSSAPTIFLIGAAAATSAGPRTAMLADVRFRCCQNAVSTCAGHASCVLKPPTYDVGTTPTMVSHASVLAGPPSRMRWPTGSASGKCRRANDSLTTATGIDSGRSPAAMPRPFRTGTPNVEKNPGLTASDLTEG